ncbi:HK97 family phage prohead protease [Bacillus toyonensis]|uniref:HK97 family phage prohead protease n=1 Tax=Bacillus toyonensis TaxID=155322 RepID=UPI000CD849DB|nr:HK97 family phage prohead protease [Bacillus toyonensis]MED3538272.1 HK97 family phage prohead protease [Bacillus toyonensis]MEE2017008.1 HK97 family phage prohead protease [Bacillus toyonensis]
MKIEVRGNQVILDGYVNVVDRESRMLPSPRGYFKERIVPKTFEKALKKATNVDLLFNHDKNRNLGSIENGNLELYEDNIGLRAIATVTDEQVIEKARKKKLRGWSFGFVAEKDSWEEGESGVQKRSIEELELLEVSILDMTPAYVATSIETRGENATMIEMRSTEVAVKTVVEDDTEERNNLIKQIKKVLEDN